MPNPIRGDIRQLTFNSDALAKRPELALRLVTVMNEWNKLEGVLGVLLGTLLGTRYSVAVSTLASVVNFTARLDLIKAAASAARPDFADKVGARMALLRSRAGERNKVVHGCWAVSDDYPEHLIHCPTEAIAFSSALGAEGHDPTFNVLRHLQPSLMLWGDKCFRALEKRIGEENAATITLSNLIATTPVSSQDPVS